MGQVLEGGFNGGACISGLCMSEARLPLHMCPCCVDASPCVSALSAVRRHSAQSLREGLHDLGHSRLAMIRHVCVALHEGNMYTVDKESLSSVCLAMFF